MGHERFSLQRMRENARTVPMRTEKGRARGLLLHFTIFGAAFAVTCLYFGMRGIMRLGGMVASGGPYAIAHPAPPWAWILPVSIFLGTGCFFLDLFSGDPDGVDLMPLAWPALFLSGSWNFLEFAFPIGRIVAGWLVCGMLFVLMGGLPLLLALKPALERIRSRLQKGEGLGAYATQWLLVVAEVVAAIFIFDKIAG